MPEKKSKRIEKLNEARRNAWEKMSAYRDHDLLLKQNFAGTMYMDKSNSKLMELPYNKIQQEVTIYMRLLASSRPQVLVSTEYKELRPFANTLELSINRRLREIAIESAFKACTLNAMFSLGVMKTGLGEGDEEFEIDGQLYDPGISFSAPVSLRNFIIDTMATDISQVGFIGDRYLRPLEWVQDTYKVTKEQAKKGMNPENAGQYLSGDRVSTSDYDPQYDIFDQVWMWDIYSPKTNLMYTFIDDVEKPVREMDREGPESMLGPYDVLGFVPVPDEVLPIGPANTAYPMHRNINNTGRKLADQTHRQKTVLAYTEGSADDAKRMSKAEDGGVMRVDDINNIKEFSTGGPDPMNNNMLIQTMNYFDMMAGNLQSLGGLAPQSETAKQDSMLRESANTLVNAMRTSVVQFARNIIKRHAWYLWTDPIREQTVTKRVEGTDIEFTESFTPEEREGDWLDYNFNIETYSTRDEPPSEKAEKLMGMWNVIMQNPEIAIQNGWSPNFEGFVRNLSKYYNVPFNDLLVAVDPNMPQDEKGGQVPAPARMKSSHTVNERVSRSGTTERGFEQELIKANQQAASQTGNGNGEL